MFHARGGCPNCRRRGEVQRVRWKRWNKSLYSPMPQLTTRLILAKKTLGHHQMNCGSTGVCLHTPGSCQIGQSSRHWLTGCLAPLRDGAFAGCPQLFQHCQRCRMFCQSCCCLHPRPPDCRPPTRSVSLGCGANDPVHQGNIPVMTNLRQPL
jgi:hypothetical protein